MVKEIAGKRPRSPRVARKYAKAQQDILEVAERILLDKGADAVTLASVAKALGMTKQAIYHYFPSKEVLVRKLVTTLLDGEIEALITAVETAKPDVNPLGTLIRAFYEHYAGRLDAYRFVYCQSQLMSANGAMLDEDTLRDDINPRTRHLFDVLEERLAKKGASKRERERLRRLAFSAWTSALGLVTILGVADATNDPLIHADKDLLECLSSVFDRAT
jgi:AcrR family transcriptional regulator